MQRTYIIFMQLCCALLLLPLPAAAQIGPQQPILQLSAPSYSADEGGGSITVTISRSGQLSTTVGVTLTTMNGSALAGSDYTPVITTVVFSGALGTSPRTVQIPILDDAIGEHRESLAVTLSAPTGGAILGGWSSAVLYIDNNDAPPAPTLSVDASPNPRQLELSWMPAAGATSYTSYYRPHPRGVFTVLGTHSASSTSAYHDISVLSYPWASAKYKVRACNTQGCADSNVASVPLAAALRTIGYFKPSDPTPMDDFGFAVALSADGTTLAVGAPNEPTRIGSGALAGLVAPYGAVFVFRRQPNGAWLEEARLKAQSQDSDDFGYSIALSSDGDTIVIGAPGDLSGSEDCCSGAAYVFTRAGTQWSNQAYLRASNPDEFDRFGDAVAISSDGNIVAAGAPYENAGGAVYLFARSGTQWTTPTRVTTPNTEVGDTFGYSVALSADGTTLAVGAQGESSSATGAYGAIDLQCNAGSTEVQCNDATVGAGATYVFTRAGSQWSLEAYIKASNTDQPGSGAVTFGENFGSSVALSADGNTLAVGAPWEASIDGDPDNNDGIGIGAVYVYARTAGQWSQPAYLKANAPREHDWFGNHVALSGDGARLVVGAPQPPPPWMTQFDPARVGTVHLYRRNAPGWVHSRSFNASNPEFDDRFGVVAIDADGSTIAVGAVGEDSLDPANQSDNSGWAPWPERDGAGAVYLY